MGKMLGRDSQHKHRLSLSPRKSYICPKIGHEMSFNVYFVCLDLNFDSVKRAYKDVKCQGQKISTDVHRAWVSVKSHRVPCPGWVERGRRGSG